MSDGYRFLSFKENKIKGNGVLKICTMLSNISLLQNYRFLILQFDNCKHGNYLKTKDSGF